MKAIICCVDPSGSATVFATTDIRRAFRRHTGVPVSGIVMNPENFKYATGIATLPATVPVEQAARIFCGLKLEPAIRDALLHRLGQIHGPVVRAAFSAMMAAAPCT